MEKDTVALKVNGEIKDLSYQPAESDTVEQVSLNSEDGIHVLRHSTAHVMAQAVSRIFPGVQYGIGPVVENGLYYDFANVEPFTPEDLKKIEKEMLKIVNEQQTFVRREVTKAEARKEFADQPYKIELIDRKGSGESEDSIVSIYDNVSKDGKVMWKDLCMGPHLPNTKFIKNAFKTLRASAAYWLGNENNDTLQRIYATAFTNKQDLNEYLQRLEEAKKRDHRKLGTELDLFSFSEEIGSGLPLFHPNGGIIRMEMENYSREKHLKAGYSFVNTPHITKENLYKTSGHLAWYKDAMFPPMRVDEHGGDHDNANSKQGRANYYLKPMNCPMHNIIFASRARSYRELPLRLFEFGSVYRFEKSGVVHGLTRVRGLTQDDSHIYCTREQMKDELTNILKFIIDLLRDFGLNDFYLELSTKDPKKYVGDDAIWEEATKTLYEVGTDFGLDLVDDPAGAAFYGPKISVQARDAIGRTWQISTIQLDFNLPELFDLEYQDKDGTRKRPVMIHRALFGSVERFFAILTEHYAGAFPAWLAPIQVLGIPVAEEYEEYLQGVLDKLKEQGVRVELDYSSDRFAKKVRNASKRKVPFVLIAGAEDMQAGAVSFRYRSGKQENGIPIDKAIEKIVNAIKSKTNALDPE